MSLRPTAIAPVPEDTARIARAAFPKGTLLMRVRDELGTIFHDEMFAAVYPSCGQPACVPWRLALVTLMQFVETLSDRQAAEAVRSRIDWKYALGLELTDPGFDFTVLSEFRARLIAGGLEEQLLATLVERCKERGWIKARGQQRTDSTHVLAAIRVLSRLELVGETLRAALNDLALAAPEWLRAQVEADWFERYGRRIEDDRLPKGEAARRAHGEAIGRDGHHLLAVLWAPSAPPVLRALPAVETLRRVWVQQFHGTEGGVHWRAAADLPPARLGVESPYETTAHYGTKRSATWTGYKVHLTETCDADAPHLIVQVTTAPAPEADADRAAPIQTALVAQDLAPETHLLDAGYVDAALLVNSRAAHAITVIGPVRPEVSWQAATPGAYDLGAFTIDWDEQRAICPQGQVSRYWTAGHDAWGNPTVSVQFAAKSCAVCPARQHCTRALRGGRTLRVRQQVEHEALQAARREQQTAAWKARYAKRAGIEGTISEAVRVFGLRNCRYLGDAKTRLQHLATAAALNLARIEAWLCGRPRAATRRSAFAALQPQAA
jgi:transposase